MDEAGALGISHARVRALAGRVNPPEKDHRRVAHDGSAGGLIAFSSAPPDVCVLQDLDDDGSDGEWLLLLLQQREQQHVPHGRSSVMVLRNDAAAGTRWLAQPDRVRVAGGRGSGAAANTLAMRETTWAHEV